MSHEHPRLGSRGTSTRQSSTRSKNLPLIGNGIRGGPNSVQVKVYAQYLNSHISGFYQTRYEQYRRENSQL